MGAMSIFPLMAIFLAGVNSNGVAVGLDPEISAEEQIGKAFMKGLNRISSYEVAQITLAYWNYQANMTDENLKIYSALATQLSQDQLLKMKAVGSFNYKLFQDPILQRQFASYNKSSAVPTATLQKLNGMVNAMSAHYGTIRICSYRNRTQCDLELEPDLTMILMKSVDPEELKYYWQEWYNIAGKPMRANFENHIPLKNEVARANGFPSMAEAWVSAYGGSSFEKRAKEMFLQVRPLFEELHAFVRHGLTLRYGEKVVPSDGPIPMHLLGNMWAQTWSNVEKFLIPFPEAELPNLTEEMHRQNYTVTDMFKLAEKFFVSIGLFKMSDSFWKNSILEKPTDDRKMACHATAFNLNNGTDYRIRQCTRVTMEDLITVHHEMGHIEYFMLYSSQPQIFRASSNAGFHEAVGDLIALSVMTPKYWKEIGLIEETPTGEGTRINSLFRMALAKIPTFQFVLALESWRYGAFRGQIKTDELNCKYWEHMLEILGVKPPVQRSEASDFDPPAKYHISNDIEYGRYFIANIVQFQMHKGLCMAAGEYGPDNPDALLSDCSVYGSQAAGDLLRKTLSMGSSTNWPYQLEMLTGTPNFDVGPMLEYFDPLYQFLVKFNRENGIHVGWNTQSDCIPNQFD